MCKPQARLPFPPSLFCTTADCCNAMNMLHRCRQKTCAAELHVM